MDLIYIDYDIKHLYQQDLCVIAKSYWMVIAMMLAFAGFAINL
jgi:hypothetical protein